MIAIAEFFIENAIKSVLLACLVAVLALLPKIRTMPSLQHCLWGLVLLAMIVPTVVHLPLIAPSSSAQTFPQPITPTPITENNHSASKIVRVKPPVPMPDSAGVISRESTWVVVLVMAVWVGGAVSLIAVTCKRYLTIRRTIQLACFDSVRLTQIAERAAKILGIHRPIKVATIQSIASPFIWVERRSIYVVVARGVEDSLDDERLLGVMLHELSHYRRCDHWVSTVGFLIVSICWWNPVSWIAFSKMRILQEVCCDAMAIAKSRLSRREYAECLYNIATFIEGRNSCLPASACELFGHKNVEKRFKMIANDRVGFETNGMTAVLVLMFAACLPCTLTYSQTDKAGDAKAAQQSAKQADDSKELNDTLERFNRFVKEGDWKHAEELANQTAEKLGHEDALVQNLLLTSINGLRKSQGLAPIIPEKLVADPKAEKLPIAIVYSLNGVLPENAADKSKFVEILIPCINASIASGGETETKSTVVFDKESERLVVMATRAQHKLIAEILWRFREKQKP